MSKQTPLYEEHKKSNASFVDFFGWEMPIHYGSQIEEHHIVRQDAGMFDVSHMTIVDIHGPETDTFLRYLLANDIAKLTHSGKALYTCMLNQEGHILDDLIVYKFKEDTFRLIVNAATREKDLAWIQEQIKPFKATIKERDDLVMIAVQGPKAVSKVCQCFPSDEQSHVTALKPFTSLLVNQWQIARTGYTGEDGLEILLPKEDAPDFWQTLHKQGVQPCGLGARDTLRLEAGLNLYGVDMDESTSPLVSNLSWTIAWEPKERDFIGRKALEQEKQNGIKQKLVGLVLQTKGVLRNHQKVLTDNNNEGIITSGSFSPTLNKAIALARIPIDASHHCNVIIRNKQLPADIVKPPFVRKGQIVFKPLSEGK